MEGEFVPHELLELLLDIEAQHGRVRTIHWGDRSLDLDLLLMRKSEQGAPWMEIEDEALTLPHPRICERDFVLRPLLDLLPQLQIQGQAARERIERIAPENRTIRRQLTQTLRPEPGK